MDSIGTASSSDSAKVVSLGDMTRDINVTVAKNIEITDAANISNAVKGY